MSDSSKKSWYVLFIEVLLVLLGGLLAAFVQTNDGTVTLKDVRFVGMNGTMMSALLYVPKLALDQTGHGYSAPPVLANAFGGPDGLKYIHTLDIVDKNNIGLEAHAMGGWASVIAAQTFPNDNAAMVLEGSSTGTYGAITGTVTFLRNLGLVFSQFDEFSTLMWGALVPRDIAKTAKMQTQFGVSEPVQVGKLYGSIENGTERKLYQPAATHPQDHISPEAIGAAIEWFQMTLKGGNNLPPSDQIWIWKEFGTFVAFIGRVLFFPLGALLLQTSFFKPLAEFKRVIGFILMFAVPVHPVLRRHVGVVQHRHG